MLVDNGVIFSYYINSRYLIQNSPIENNKKKPIKIQFAK